jgi:hypothetical protein
MGFKAAFVLLLIQGAWALKRPGARLVPARYLALGILVYAAICAALPLVIEQVGVVQHTTMKPRPTPRRSCPRARSTPRRSIARRRFYPRIPRSTAASSGCSRSAA